MLAIIITTLVVLIWIIFIYNSLISKRNKVKEAFASVDVQLKRRYDQIPNLVEIAKEYMKYEKTTLETITNLRNQYSNLSNSFNDMGQKMAINKELSTRTDNIIFSIENYPELKANQSIVLLIKTYNEIEEHISASRRFYNSAVNELKNAVEMFPSSVVAMLAGIKSQNFFSIEELERTPVKIKF